MDSGSEEPTFRAALQVGERLGQYRILKMLGRGGMGEVYLAENVLMNNLYALKTLPQRYADDPQFVARFRVEARVMADLDHPNIVKVHYMGNERGLYFLVMDYVVGPEGEPWTLDDMLAGGRKIPEAQCREFAIQICRALIYAHGSRGEQVIHRDLKPSNVLLTRGTLEERERLQVKLSDFGLAKVLGGAYLRTVMEKTGTHETPLPAVSVGDEDTELRRRLDRASTRSILGTFDYMSPEQKGGGVVTAQSDLYSFGVLLYRMLTGRKPEGHWRLPSHLGYDRDWDGIVARCLEVEPEDRYPSADDIMRDLEAVAKHRARKALTWVLLAGVGLLIAALAAVMLVRKGARTTGAGPEGGGPSADEVTLPDDVPGEGGELRPLIAGRDDRREIDGPPGYERPAWMTMARLLPASKDLDPVTGLPQLLAHGPTGIRLKLIQPGEFSMGSGISPEEAAVRYGGAPSFYKRERPQRTVRISRGFYLGQFEVSNAEYRRCFPTYHSGEAYGMSLDEEDQPVAGVSSYEVRAFCKRYGMRLPTEAEWEYACRAGSQSLYSWGDAAERGKGLCNVHDESSSRAGVAKRPAFPFDDGHVVSAPTGSFKPNAFDLYDMHGNVGEWCSDQFQADFYATRPNPDVDPVCERPQGETFGCVMRGGSWKEGPERVRCAFRDWGADQVRGDDLGFRVVFDIPEHGTGPSR